MHAHVHRILAIRSTRFLLVVFALSYVLLDVGWSFSTASSAIIMEGANHGADTACVFLGVFGAVSVSGAASQGDIALEILAFPNRLRVLVSRLLVNAVCAAVSSGAAFLASYGAVTLILMARHVHVENPGLAVFLLRFLAVMLIAVLYTSIGTGLGFLTESTAGSVAAFLGLILGLPMLSTLAGLINGKVFQFLLACTPVSLTSSIMSGFGAKWIIGVAGLLAWGVAAMMFGWLRFRRYVPCQ
jgi:hypothetical protein